MVFVSLDPAVKPQDVGLSLSGCIAFFNPRAQNPEATADEKAVALAAVAEDEARQDQFKSHKPCCVVS